MSGLLHGLGLWPVKATAARWTANPDVSGGQGISEPAGWQPVPRWVDCILLSQPSFGAYVRHMYLSIATLPSSNRSWGTQTALWGTPGFPSSNAVSHIGLRQPFACVRPLHQTAHCQQHAHSVSHWPALKYFINMLISHAWTVQVDGVSCQFSPLVSQALIGANPRRVAVYIIAGKYS